MKKIAITQRIIKNDTYYEIREALDIRWGRLFKELNFLPIILPYKYDFKKYDFDGVILSGGNDIGEIELRDKFEYSLIEYCLEQDIPIFGVCRGLQIVAKYFNSTFKKVDNQIGLKHNLVVNKHSKYAKFLKKIDIVNSYHNIAIDRLDDNLTISAWNEDKTIIKAIEHKKKKIFAVMWHSEREEPFRKEELQLIMEFFQ